MLELDVLPGDGRVVTCTPDNEHRDLFFGFPEFLRHARLRAAGAARARSRRSRTCDLTHRRFDEPTAFFAALARRCATAARISSTARSSAPDEHVPDARPLRRLGAVHQRLQLRAHLLPLDPRARRGLPHRRATIIWRWDTDWFWCSKNVVAQNPLVRRLLGRERLGSRTYQKIMRWNSRVGSRARSTGCAGCIPSR